MRALSVAAMTVAAVVAIAGGRAAAQAPPPLAAFDVVVDAVPRSLTGRPGDAERGRAIAFDPLRGNCSICHAIPPETRFHGDLGPSLDGVAGRLSEGEMRLRMIDSRRVNADTIMPSYYRVAGLVRVGGAFRDRPVLSAEDIEDLVAFLSTLRNAK